MRTHGEQAHTASALGSLFLFSKRLLRLPHQPFPVVYGMLYLVLLMLALERFAVVPAVCNAERESRIPEDLIEPTRKSTDPTEERKENLHSLWMKPWFKCNDLFFVDSTVQNGASVCHSPALEKCW